jgi:hypothetical protein
LMMLGSGHLISGFDVATGTFMLMLFSAGVAALVLAIVVRFVVRRAGQSGVAGVFWVCGLALVGAMLVYALLERSTKNDQAAERRAIDARAAELTARSLASGSALGCLDAVANTLVEDACERPLFASPEAIAAAVAYVDARLSLLAASAPLAERDPTYQPVFERLRRGLEADRYGLVAHVLMTRGCNGTDCAELRLLRDTARVVANMKSHAFEASIGAHALAWPANGSGANAQASAAPASAPSLPSPQATTGATVRTPALSSVPPAPTTPGSAKFDFPSANSIPPVSIMNAEPGAPSDAEPRSTPAPKRPAPAPRRQTAKEGTPVTPPPPPHAPPQRTTQPAPPPPPPPPVQVAPEVAAPPESAVHDPHATR